jgi:hypothetical protein
MPAATRREEGVVKPPGGTLEWRRPYALCAGSRLRMIEIGMFYFCSSPTTFDSMPNREPQRHR